MTEVPVIQMPVTQMPVTQLSVAIVRGGTSKGVFLRLGDLPADPADRDRMLLRLMGSPDPMQLDGLGGTHSSTSKVMAVGPATDPGADVDYLFAQVAVEHAVVDLTGNCGNLTAAVGHYAIDEGLVPAIEPVTMVRLRNLNTGVIIQATVPVAGGRAAWEGDTAIDGVPGTGARIVTDYLSPAGSVTGALFPTGSPVDELCGHRVSIVDVSSPYVFASAVSFGLTGTEQPAELNSRAELLAEIEAVRREAGRRIGVDSLAIPRTVLVAPGHDLRVLATSMGRFHHAVPMTGALCIGAAARLPRTVVNELAQPGQAEASGPEGHHHRVSIEHPKGMVETTVCLDGDRVVAAGVVRTARRLLTGTAHL
jgi:2-methylaconitate isomerase